MNKTSIKKGLESMKHITLFTLMFLIGTSALVSACSRELKSMDDERPQQPWQLEHIPLAADLDMLSNTPAITESEPQGSTVESEEPVFVDNGEGTEVSSPEETVVPEINPPEDEEDPVITNLMNGGRLAIQTGDYSKAIDYFNLVLERDPNHTGALYNISLIYRLTDQPDKAVEWALKAVESDPDRLFVYQNLGNAYEMTGDMDAAIEAFEEELIRHPDVKSLAPLASQLSILYRERGLIEDAIDAALTAITLDPGEPNYFLLLGDSYLERKSYDQAIDAFTDALEIAPDSTEILVRLGDTEWENGNQESALEYYNRAIAVDSSVRDSIPAERLEEVEGDDSDESVEPDEDVPLTDQPL